MPIVLNGTSGIVNNATDLNYTGTLTGGTGVVNFGSGQFYKDASGNTGIGTSLPGVTLDIRSTAAAAARVSRSGTSGQITSLVFEDGSATLGTANTTRIASASGYLAFSTGGTSGDTAGGTEQARITSAGLMQFNSGYGSVATAYGCRAWVNFNGTGTVAIRASGNVSSITDNGVGDFTVNFSTAMPDVNFSAVISSGNPSGTPNIDREEISAYTTSSCRMLFTMSGVASIDPTYVNVAIFR